MLPLLLALLATPAQPPSAPPAPPPATRPVRVSATLSGRAAEIEVRDLAAETARQAIQAAFDEMAAVARLAEPDSDANDANASGAPGSLAALNAAAGRGPQAVDPRLLPALGRALDFCLWSEKAFGPLGRDINRLWGVRAAVQASPVQKAELLDKAVAVADCERLQVDTQKGTAALAEGSAADLWGFAEGLAVDRGVEILRQRGVRNGYVHLGGIHRGFGPGVDGKGWSVAPPLFPGTAIPLNRIYLRDKALAIAAAADRPLRIGAETFSPWISHRTGLPVQGTVATLAFSDLALDAQGLAVTMTVTGPSEGQLRLGSLRPSPSLLWLQGSGAGEPLQITYHWGDVPTR